MLGGKNKQPLGYTIVEVMIVLAVSGVMFVVAANFINGKQERAAFNQSVSGMIGQIQGTADDVTDGHYSDVPVACPVGGGASQSQGSNANCVFLGKIIHFYKSGTTQPQNYQTLSIAAARSVVGQLPNNSVAAIPGLTSTGAIPQGFYVTSMTVHSASGDDTSSYNIGFTQGLGSTDVTQGAYRDGAQTVSLIYASGAGLSNNGAGPWSESDVTGSKVKPAQYASICLTDGTRRAKLLIGNANNDSQFSINVTQQGLGTTCT